MKLEKGSYFQQYLKIWLCIAELNDLSRKGVQNRVNGSRDGAAVAIRQQEVGDGSDDADGGLGPDAGKS